MYSGKIAVPPGGGGLRCNNNNVENVVTQSRRVQLNCAQNPLDP
jgi:hypothetical protein